jgi:endonuclease/exonuclease/phosphatase family metal-dependent hydrolase
MEEKEKIEEDKRTDAEKIVEALRDISGEIFLLKEYLKELLKEQEKHTDCLEAIARR